MNDRDAAAMFQEICDKVSLGVFCLTAHLTIVYWNGWLADKTGIPPSAALGKTLGELFPGFSHPRFVSAAKQVLDHKSPQVLSQALNRYLIPIRIPTSERHGLALMQQNVFMYPLSPPSNARICVTINDVT
jgi:hypothetical protein